MCLFSVVLNIFTINAALHGFLTVEYFPDFLSVSQFACVGGWVQFSLSLSVCLSISLSLCVCLSLSLSVSVCLSVCLSLFLSLAFLILRPKLMN